MFIQDERSPSERQIIELTSFMMHKHYCENDVEPIIALMDDDIVWIGAAEQEYAIGVERVASIFRQFVGQVPKCNIGREEVWRTFIGCRYLPIQQSDVDWDGRFHSN